MLFITYTAIVGLLLGVIYAFRPELLWDKRMNTAPGIAVAVGIWAGLWILTLAPTIAAVSAWYIINEIKKRVGG